MAGILTERPQQIQNIYWQPGHPIGVPVSHFRQIKDLPLSNSVTDIDQALSEARVDCVRDLHKQLFAKFGVCGNSSSVTVLVEDEPANPMANKQPFEQYLSGAPSHIFRHEKTLSALSNIYIDYLTDRIREFNVKFICDKFGLRLARIF